MAGTAGGGGGGAGPGGGAVSAPAAGARDEALARVRRLKAWLVAASVGGFGAFAGAAALHVTGVTARRASAGGAATSGLPPFGSPQSENFAGGGGFGQGDGGFGFSNGAGGGVGQGVPPAAATTAS
jgi:hypothetical protein